jgi:hypothetical protein
MKTNMNPIIQQALLRLQSLGSRAGANYNLAKSALETIPQVGGLNAKARANRNLQTQQDVALKQAGYGQLGVPSQLNFTPRSQLNSDLQNRLAQNALMAVANVTGGDLKQSNLDRSIQAAKAQRQFEEDANRALGYDHQAGPNTRLKSIDAVRKAAEEQAPDELAKYKTALHDKVLSKVNKRLTDQASALDENLTQAVDEMPNLLKDKKMGYRALDSSGKGAALGPGKYLAPTVREAQMYGKNIQPYDLPSTEVGTNVFTVKSTDDYNSLVKNAIQRIYEKTGNLPKGDKNTIGLAIRDWAIDNGYTGVNASEVGLGEVTYLPKNLKANLSNNSIGAIQRDTENPLLTQFDDAINSGNKELAQKVIEKMKQIPSLKQYIKPNTDLLGKLKGK